MIIAGVIQECLKPLSELLEKAKLTSQDIHKVFLSKPLPSFGDRI